MKYIFALIEFSLKVIWDLVIIVAAIGLTIARVVFLFGSVLGVVLVLIFLGLDGFLFPLLLFGFLTDPRKLKSLD